MTRQTRIRIDFNQSEAASVRWRDRRKRAALVLAFRRRILPGRTSRIGLLIPVNGRQRRPRILSAAKNARSDKMDADVLPRMNMETDETGCCPRFDPLGWDGRHLVFKDKPFVRATTRNLLHVPINIGSVFTRVQNHIDKAGAQEPNGYLVMSRDLSPSQGEHLFAVTKDVPNEEMIRLSGEFIARVFEGPYRHAKNWVHDMQVAAEADGHAAKRVFMFFTNCPKCAKVYGKNYVVGLAEI
jgi:hypothetical protein